MDLNWNFRRGGGLGVQTNEPSVGGVWIFLLFAVNVMLNLSRIVRLFKVRGVRGGGNLRELMGAGGVWEAEKEKSGSRISKVTASGTKRQKLYNNAIFCNQKVQRGISQQK